MEATKINCTKITHTINVSVVRSRSYENFSTQKFTINQEYFIVKIFSDSLANVKVKRMKRYAHY